MYFAINYVNVLIVRTVSYFKVRELIAVPLFLRIPLMNLRIAIDFTTTTGRDHVFSGFLSCHLVIIKYIF